jgi:aminopeptidase 2
MCRHFGADDHSSSVDITKGREVLPTNVKPLHYDLTLEPDFENFTYNGTVTIEYAPIPAFLSSIKC